MRAVTPAYRSWAGTMLGVASFKSYKKGLKPIEDQEIENGRGLFEKVKLPKWDWSRRGSWHSQPIKLHPGRAGYHANKDKS
jgi:hypothetical protein